MSQNKIIWPWMESDRSVSMRRCLAMFFALLAAALFYLALPYSKNGWFVFLPGIVCVAAVLLLLFFTTWNDITELVQAAVGIVPKAPSTPGAGSEAAADSIGR